MLVDCFDDDCGFCIGDFDLYVVVVVFIWCVCDEVLFFEFVDCVGY